MKTKTQLILEDKDFNRLCDILGLAWRNSENYEELVVALKKEGERLADEAFILGQKNKDEGS